MMPDTDSNTEIRKTGHRLADLTLAGSALFVSFCSLAIAVHHGHTMQRLVEANSRPFIQFSSSDGEHTDHGVEQVFSVKISNPGSGAARIERFSIIVDGKNETDWLSALDHLTATGKAAKPAAGFGRMALTQVAPSYLKAGSDQEVFRWYRSADNGELWDQVVASSPKRVRLEACYCSIFDECWIESSQRFRPTSVKSCDI